MRYNRVLFVTPYSPGRYFGGVRPPVGIAYIEEYIARHGVQTAAVDMTLGLRFHHLKERIESAAPALMGVTLMTYQYRHTLSMLQRVRDLFPQVAIVVGGPHVSALGAQVLSQCAAIDFAIEGEGEVPMRDLCLGRDLTDIAGLHYRADGQIRSGAQRDYLEDLDQLPFPRFSSYPLHKYTREVEIVTSRGCPHSCIFCAAGTIMGRCSRFRGAEAVADEMAYFYRKGTRSFEIGDDNFLANKSRVMEVLEALHARGLKGLTLRCGQGIRADLVEIETLTAMKRSGFQQLGVGVESANDAVLKALRKNLTSARADEGIARCCELGFDVSLFFVVGAPGETIEDTRRSIALAEKYPVMKAFFFNLIPFPGTQLYDWVAERHAFLASYDEMINRVDELKLRSQPFFTTEEMPEKDRIEALRISERASKRIRVRTLKRKLETWGPLGALVAEAGRFDEVERLFVRNRLLRGVTDWLVFGERKRT